MRADEFYSRYANPTVRAFEEAVAELEGAEDALAFASGMGAIASVVFALCSAGDHIVAQRQIYAGTSAFAAGAVRRASASTSRASTAPQPGAFAEAVRPGRTMLVIAESPSNPRLDLVDLDDLGAIAGPFTVVDSTFATPIGQQPLAPRRRPRRCTRRPRASAATTTPRSAWSPASATCSTAIWAYAVLHGACASPFDALNGLRGIRTLAVRQRHQAASALRPRRRAGRPPRRRRRALSRAVPTTRSTSWRPAS